MLLCAALVMFGICLSILWFEDIRSFEIKLEVLPILVVISYVLAPYFDVAWQSMLAGGVAWFAPALLYQYLRPSGMGRGDIFLFAVAGLFFSLDDSLLGGAVFLAVSAATAYGYARARGKQFGRSLYPAAMPVVIAMLTVLEGRLLARAANSEAHAILAYAPMLLPFAGILIGALICAPTLDEEGREI